MEIEQTQPSTRMTPLIVAWTGLVILTLTSIGLGEWFSDLPGLLFPVAAIIWLKAWLVARYFLEIPLTRPFIRRLVWIFIAFSPIALVITDLFAHQLAKWLQV